MAATPGAGAILRRPAASTDATKDALVEQIVSKQCTPAVKGDRDKHHFKNVVYKRARKTATDSGADPEKASEIARECMAIAAEMHASL